MKISTFLTTVFFSFLFSHTSAQPGFNKLLDADYDMTDMRDMVIVNDTIIGYGIGFNNPVNGNQGLVLTKFDSNGVLLKSTIILDSLGDPLAIGKTWGKIIAIQDGGFAMTASVVGRNCALLIKTDRDFGVEFIKEYEDTVNLSNFRYKLFEISDGYILYGNVQRPNFTQRSFVRRVDKFGETLWFNYYGVENLDDTFIYGSQLNDTLFVFGGVQAAATLEEGVSVLRFISGNGENFMNWFSGSYPEIGWLRSFKVLSDGSFLIFGQYLVEVITPYDVIVQPTLSKLNSDLDIEWVNHFGRIDKAELQILFLDIEPLSENNFIGAGQSRFSVNGKNEPSGWLMKFSADGDSIWSRYDFPDFPVDSLGDTFFGGVGVLSSGSIVAGGTATLWNKDAIWLVKVTNDGCLDTIFCGLVPVVEREEEKEDLKIFPNPASQSVTVSLQEASTSPGVIEIYGFDGRLVLREEYAMGEKEVLIDTSGLPAGLYAVRKMAAGQAFVVGKIVISR